MTDETRRYAPMNDDDESMRLDEVLEPYEPAQQPVGFYAPVQDDAYVDEDYGTDPYEAGGYEDSSPYDNGLQYQNENYDQGFENDPYADEEYSDYHEALDREGRLRTAMGVFNSVSTLVGVVVILVLVGMVISLISWLRADIIHSLALLQSGIN